MPGAIVACLTLYVPFFDGTLPLLLETEGKINGGCHL